MDRIQIRALNMFHLVRIMIDLLFFFCYCLVTMRLTPINDVLACCCRPCDIPVSHVQIKLV
jgi:hypothetical protein